MHSRTQNLYIIQAHACFNVGLVYTFHDYIVYVVYKLVGLFFSFPNRFRFASLRFRLFYWVYECPMR